MPSAWQTNHPQGTLSRTHLVCKELYIQLKEVVEEHRGDIGRTIVASLDYVKSLGLDKWVDHAKSVTALNEVLCKLFDQYDLLLTPTLPTEAFAAEGPPPAEIEGHSVPILWAVAFTYPFNLSGHPAATVRSGLTSSGLPAGLQIIAPHHREDLILQAAYAYERLRPWNNNWPKLSVP